jgi:hypothetical protein
MDNQEQVQAQQQQTSEQKETKEERIDELDIIGGALVKLVRNGFLKVKQIFIPHKAE